MIIIVSLHVKSWSSVVSWCAALILCSHSILFLVTLPSVSMLEYFAPKIYLTYFWQALLYADPFDVEAQKKIEAAIRQVSIFLIRDKTTQVYGRLTFDACIHYTNTTSISNCVWNFPSRHCHVLYVSIYLCIWFSLKLEK